MRINRPKKLHRNLIAAAALAAAMAGCSTEYYRESADRDVKALLLSRGRKTLQYEPQVAVNTQPPPPTPKKAYDTLPVTETPEHVKPPLEPPQVEVPFAPLGPSADDADLPQTGSMESIGEQKAEVDAVRAAAGAGLEYGPAAPGARTERLDLFGSLRYAVQHSRQYQNRMEDLYLAALDVTLQRHLFEPRPFVTQSVGYAGGQSDVNFRSALTATTDAGVRQRLPYGGEVVAEALVTFVSALNGNSENGESAALVLSGSLPLLRGAGLVNLEPLIQSERALVYGVRTFEDYRRSFAVDIASQYFSLLSAQQSVANRIQSYQDLAVLLERARAVYAAGRVGFSYIEVQRAEQNLLFAENAVLQAHESYLNALDRFKILLGMPVTDELDIVAVQLDVNVPELEGIDVLELAEKYRLDLQTARDQTEDARRAVAVAENGLLPELSLTGRTQFGNRGDTPARSIDSRSLEYTAGITLDLPVDRLAERNVYRRALIQLDQANRRFDDVRAQVQADVRQSQRAIRTSRSSLEIARVNITLAERRLELANELLRQGTQNTRDVVEAQDDLLRALDDYENAQADFQVEVLRYLRNTGTLRVDPAAGSIGRAMQREQREEPKMPLAGARADATVQ